MAHLDPPLSIQRLHRGYAQEEFTPSDVVEHLIDATDPDPHNAWISLVDRRQLRDCGKALTNRLVQGVDFNEFPLFGVPFGVKDNIDCEGLPTTAACPAFERKAPETAPVVQRLIDTGGILVGKTNLDQFATGVVGTRSPYGTCRNAIDPDYISGGSSSGSAVAVAANHVTFSLGTDTGGSGRIPAACNGVVGLKPTRGMLSNSGVIPACKSLDCVSVFALNCLDALLVERLAAGFDPDDEYSRRAADDLILRPPEQLDSPIIGVPDPDRLEFFSDDSSRRLLKATLEDLESIFELQRIDISPLVECSRLLFDGPWIVERREAIERHVPSYPDDLLDVLQAVLSEAKAFSAADVFRAEYERQRFYRQSRAIFDDIDYLAMPTIGTIHSIEAVRRAPIETNANLGLYTNFVNLLDLSAISVPAARRQSGLPFGITLVGEPGRDAHLASTGHRLCEELEVSVGVDTEYSDMPSPWGFFSDGEAVGDIVGSLDRIP